MYENLEIANNSDKENFSHYLKIHQQGQTDYRAFCSHCADTGIEKWFAYLDEMTCTYYNKAGKKIFPQTIKRLHFS